jgi:protocatechuate 3,4-dioxygenase beta subunit
MKRRLFIQGLVAGPVLASTAALAGDRMYLPTAPQNEGPFYPVADIPQANTLFSGPHMGDDLTVSGRVLNLDGSPASGARIDVWQCDAQGIYRHPRAYHGERIDPGFRGFATLQTDSNGSYHFDTIMPVPYTGRPPHIHLKFIVDGEALLTTQLYLRDRGGPRSLQIEPVRTATGQYQAGYDFVLDRLA